MKRLFSKGSIAIVLLICGVCSVFSVLSTPDNGTETTARPEATSTAPADLPANSLTEDEPEAPTNEPPPAEAVPAEEAPVEEAAPVEEPPTATVNVETLNVRTGPGADYAVISQVTSGTVLPAIGKSADDLWVQVLLDGTTPGWVGDEFVNLTRPEALTVVEAPVLEIAPTVAAAEPPAAPPAQSGYNGPHDPFGPDRNCDDFSFQSEAQRFFIAAGGPSSDPHDLDGDGDGRVCVSLP